MNIKLKPGDIFLSKNPMLLGRFINAVQKFYATDNQSKYSHAGLIITSTGRTFESLWTVKSQDLYKAYKGNEVLIGRCTDISNTLFSIGFSSIYREHGGQFYPFQRLLFHILKPFAKYIHISNHLVCSELVAKFLYRIGLKNNYLGITPDDLESMIRNYKNFRIVYEGEIK